MNCWICGQDDAATREHLAKASDLKAMFGKRSQREPLFFSASAHLGMPIRRNLRVGSLYSDRLKFTHRICLTCNSARTQPYDFAWEHCSKELRAELTRLLARGSFRANWLFPYDTRLSMCHVHLYFTKLFGCLAVEGGVPIDIGSLANAVKDGKPHPHIYLAFVHLTLPVLTVGGSDIETAQVDGKVAFATWFYNVGNLAVNLMYALPGERRQGLDVAWHPRMGAQRLRCTRFSIAD